MCQGHRLRGSSEATWRPAPAVEMAGARGGAVAAAGVDGAAGEGAGARFRHPAAARGVILERDRIKRLVSELTIVRIRLAERRRQLELDAAVAASGAD
ncbi:hypothetical protein M6B38_221155 [Iris pallida]|uniref:Uncharacterized protein n=1 Tax=Iris pallida TaxID=29817 RepID=A0AAX6DYY5_IRIPA|nr:hypothetical protein M6B38_221155 [Iris pallida]